MKNKILIISSLVAILFLPMPQAIKADDYSSYCAQAYDACLQAQSLGGYAASLGVATGLSSINCNEILAECSGSYSSGEAEDYYESNADYNQPDYQPTTDKEPELSAEEQAALAQKQAEAVWRDYLNLSSGDLLTNLQIGEDWIRTYYRPYSEEGELGLAGLAQTTHNLFAEAVEIYLTAKDMRLSPATIEGMRETMDNARFDYKEALTNVLKANPRDSTANHELAQQYFDEGTVDGFRMGRELESRAFVNLDALERQTLETRAKEEIERNGLSRAFYNPKPEESTILTTMKAEINEQYEYVEDKTIAWVKTTDTYARAMAYSRDVRGYFDSFSLDIFHVDNTVINQAAYGE